MSFNLDTLIVVFYLAATLFIGFWKGRNIKSIKEYAVGSRDYNNLTIVATIFATFAGAGTTSGVITKIQTIGMLFGIVYFGRSILMYSIGRFGYKHIEKFHNLISPGEILKVLYGRHAQILTGILSLIYSLGVLAAQIAATGYIFQYYLNVDFTWGTIIGAGIVVFYSTYGGIKSVTTTDVLQFAVLIVAIPVIGSLCLTKMGGYSGMMAQLPKNFLLKSDNYMDFFTDILPLMVFLSLAVEPPMIQRILISKNKYQVKKTMIASALIEIPFVLIIALIGLAGTILYPDVDSNLVLPHIIREVLPYGLAGFAISGMLAVLMSTTDSFLNTNSVSIVNDICNPLFKSKIIHELKYTKLMTLIFGIGGIVISIKFQGVIEIIMKVAGIWASTVMIPIFAALVGGVVKKKHFLIAVYSGCVAYFVSLFFYAQEVSPLLVGVIVNGGLFIIFLIYASISSNTGPNNGKSDNVIDHQEQSNNLDNSSETTVYFKKKPFNFNLKELSKLPKQLVLQAIDNAIKYSDNRVSYYSKQHFIFGVFAILNFFIPLFMWDGNIDPKHYMTSSAMRIFVAVCAFILMVQSYWPLKYHRYKAIYWHFCVMITLPLSAGFLFLISNNILFSVINISLALFFTAILVDSLSFIILTFLGALLSALFYSLTNNDFSTLTFNFILPAQRDISFELFYVTFFSFVIAMFFARKKETDQQQIVSTLNSMVAKKTIHLTEALSAKQNFLNNISHEIRTPMQGILSISNELDEHWDKYSEQQRRSYTSDISSNSTRLMSLISDVIDLSALESKKIKPNLQKNNLVEFIIQIISFYESKHSNIKFIFKNELENSCYVMFDSSLMKQAISHIIGNAVKYGLGKKISITINNDVICDNALSKIDAVNISIKDEGIGIPTEELSSIFNPFEQSSRTKTRSGGRGIGLALCREIISCHNGEISAINNDKNEKGACFKIKLPLLSSKKEIKGTKESSKKINKILLVDDEDICLLSGKLMLSSLGYEVITAHGGYEALEIIKQDEFGIDAILLDVMMPDLYGINLLEKLKKDHLTKSIPVILQSGIDDRDEIKKAFKLGAADFLAKPYSKQQLNEIINKILP